MIEDSPPLFINTSTFSFSSEIDILLNKKSSLQEYPVFFFGKQSNEKKYAILNAEGIWRWRLFNFKINKNHHNFDEFD